MNINMEKIIEQLLEEKGRVHINYSFFLHIAHTVMLNQSVSVPNGSTPLHCFFFKDLKELSFWDHMWVSHPILQFQVLKFKS